MTNQSKENLSKIIFFLKKGKKKAPSTRSFQNNNFIFQKSCRIYTFYKKIWC